MTLVDGYRAYRDIIMARKWINQHGLGNEIVRYDIVEGRRIMPVVLCDTLSEARAVRERKFKAELKHDALRVGATVRLSDKVPKATFGELAVVQQFLKDNTARLDRPLGGTVWWTADDLVVITPGGHG